MHEVTDCPCGQVHQVTTDSWEAIQEMLQDRPPGIEVITPAGTWTVPRMWIALHGYRPGETAALAARHGWSRADNGTLDETDAAVAAIMPGIEKALEELLGWPSLQGGAGEPGSPAWAVPLRSVRCPKCHKVSYHPPDVDEGYCGWCHAFISPPGRAEDREGDASGQGQGDGP